MSESPHLGLGYLAPAQAQKHVTVNEALRRLDALVQLGVLDRTRTEPPTSPAEGDRHIVAGGATGAWAGRDGRIAAFLDGVWVFVAPKPGWLAYVAAEAQLLALVDGAWVGALVALSTLNDLTRLGVGTAADAANPFAVKVNAMLWSAKAVAEGGDGDLRAALNKETPADVLSLLFQTGFSGRAELGLVGDDNLTVKTSANGSAWTCAMTVTTAGRVLLNTASETDPISGLSRWKAADGAMELSFRDNASGQGYLAISNSTGGMKGFLGHTNTSDGLTQGTTTGHKITFRTNGVNRGSVHASTGALEWLFPVRPAVRTIATLPAASAGAGQTVYCSDLGGGGGLLVSDGTAWRRSSPSGHETLSTDANANLAALANAELIRHTATLTANRTLTLLAGGAYPGARFLVTRTGGGAFALSVGGLKALAQNAWCEVVHDGSAWTLAAAGAL